MVELETPNGIRLFIDNKITVDLVTKFRELLYAGVITFVKYSDPNTYTYNLNKERFETLCREAMYSNNAYYKICYVIDKDNLKISYRRIFESKMEIVFDSNIDYYFKYRKFNDDCGHERSGGYENNQIDKAIDFLIDNMPELFNEYDGMGNHFISVGKIVGQVMRYLKGKMNPALVEPRVKYRLNLL